MAEYVEDLLEFQRKFPACEPSIAPNLESLGRKPQVFSWYVGQTIRTTPKAFRTVERLKAHGRAGTSSALDKVVTPSPSVREI